MNNDITLKGNDKVVIRTENNNKFTIVVDGDNLRITSDTYDKHNKFGLFVRPVNSTEIIITELTI